MPYLLSADQSQLGISPLDTVNIQRVVHKRCNIRPRMDFRENNNMKRREFLKAVAIGSVASSLSPITIAEESDQITFDELMEAIKERRLWQKEIVSPVEESCQDMLDKLAIARAELSQQGFSPEDIMSSLEKLRVELITCVAAEQTSVVNALRACLQRLNVL